MHVFRAFKSADTPNTNMAEAGHLRNATRGAKNKSLATVAEEHIVESALLKSKLEMHESGTYKGGHCPTQRQNTQRHLEGRETELLNLRRSSKQETSIHAFTLPHPLLTPLRVTEHREEQGSLQVMI